MKTLSYLLLVATLLLSCDLVSNESGKPVNDDLWVNAYLKAEHYNPQTSSVNNGILTDATIGWDALTHLTFHSLRVAPNGSPLIDPDSLNQTVFNTERLTAITTAAHAQNKKILLGVGSEDNYEGFSIAMVDTNRQRFIATILNTMERFNFDGVNLHLLPILPEDYNNFGIFIIKLSERLKQAKQSNGEAPLLTLTAMRSNSMMMIYSNVQEYVDQINLQTYAMTQPWRGWKAWHSSALYNTSVLFDSTETVLYPSVNGKVEDALELGIQRSKIGVGISFYGYIWDYVHLMEIWPSWPTEDLSLWHPIPYTDVSDSINLDDQLWDTKARVPYINLIKPKAFASFENEKSIQEKVSYAKNKRLGGIMVWDLGAAHLPNRSSSQSDPLLQAIKEQSIAP